MTDKPHKLDQPAEPTADVRAALSRVDEAVLILARLLGRQIARDEFERRQLTADTPSPEDPTTR
ncbi:hypothetical protein [Caulobacter sp. DWP3-1-3b2]|uniref:hypothetical protein n=1 Tax=Caulobacter sp. DWP3-1-3b2 TaxID=2804643 RepID=UPI003CFA9C05